LAANQQNLYDTFVVESQTVIANERPVTAIQGMCVTKHTSETYDITSINDLTDPDKAAVFDKDGDGTPEVWIGAPGWASTVIEQVRAKSYGYDQNMAPKQYDGTVAWGELGTAFENDEPWIGFCYEPNFIFVAYDMVYLEQPAHYPATWTIVQPTDDPNWLELSEASTAWNGAKLHMHYAASVREDYPEVARGEIFCIMGLSGSGKSTLVRHVSRLIEPSAGTIKVLGEDVAASGKKGAACHAIPLEIRNISESKRWAISEHTLGLVDLEGYGDRLSKELSGGMQQRVGIAHALASDPEILLMDEPFFCA